MKTRLMLLAGLACACLVSGRALEGGDKKQDDPFANLPKPGPEHKMLAKLSGNWTAEVKAWFGPGEPKESKGTLARKMILDGRYLQETFDGEFFGTKFKGVGLIAYDTAKKKYVMAWIDNMATGISISEGSYDPKTKAYTYIGEEDGPEMGKMKTRDVLSIVSDDEERFEMFRTPLKEKDAKEFKVVEITYARKKKASK
jgi:Protein of unknown function (DUF1579)